MNSRERIRICLNQNNRKKGSLSANQMLRQVLVLCEGRQFLEAAHLVDRLNSSSLALIQHEIPFDLLLEALPFSAFLLESLLRRMSQLTPTRSNEVWAEKITWNLVHLFSLPHDPVLVRKCENLIGFLCCLKPQITEILKDKETSLDSAVQALAVHGLTNIRNEHDGNFMSLCTALRKEMKFHIETYKQVLNLLDTQLNNCDPASSSHQRLLNLSFDDVQRRLIFNKTLLTKFETSGFHQLQNLIENLKNRVEKDKEVLVCVNQIKKTAEHVDLERSAAKIIIDFKKGCSIVLTHMSQNNSVLSTEESYGSDGYHSEVETPSDKSRVLKEEYLKLYKISHANALKLLNKFNHLDMPESMKLKILFSITVLAFKSCHNLRELKLKEVDKCFATDKIKNAEAVERLKNSVETFLLSSCEEFPLDDVENQVVNKVQSALQQYSCINDTLLILKIHLRSTARLAWKLVVNKMYLDMNFTLSTLDQNKHLRSTTSNHKSNIIQAFLLPALFWQNECLVKAIVVT